MLYVYITKQCYEDASAIGTKDSVESLKAKLVREQSTQGLEQHPKPFLKKCLGRTRLIIAEVFDGQDVILCFLRHVYKHEIGDDYKALFDKIRVPKNDDPELISFLQDARAKPIDIRDPLNDLELEYLNLDRQREMGEQTILESPFWIKGISFFKETPGKQGLLAPIWELVQQIYEHLNQDNKTGGERHHEKYDLSVLYRYFPDNHYLLLIAPLEGTDSNININIEKVRKLLKDSEAFDEDMLLRNAIRAYPDFILYDREIWESTQASIEANLALSPEENQILNHVLDPTKQGGFPLFINGRPGSGKSTILQYLFAEYLYTHLAQPLGKRLSRTPLYLTYNERLLDAAKKVVEDIFRCGAEKRARTDLIDLEDQTQKIEFDNSFVYFRKFLLDQLEEGEFDPKKYIDFHIFQDKYFTLLKGPDSKLRKLAPEVAWHILRTYIKGKSSEGPEYFDPSSYSELPRDEITVTAETYKLVWDKVWNGWYKNLCENEGYWDDQDLTRRVLDLDLVPSEYPGVFCDESQDFTTIELELIFRLSFFTTKRVDPHDLKRIPYVFAGDPFQTLNPTGFRWDAIKANFHNNIVRQLDPDRRGKVQLSFKELAFNYRSTTNIVRFCNLMQLKRATLFDITDVTPQKAWAIDEGAWPAYFEFDLNTQANLREQSELVIIVPCQEGEEKVFIENDDYLKTIALDSKKDISRNVLSPMRAKGLEFRRVVLYKFGDQAKRDQHISIMQRITKSGFSNVDRQETLGLEYFFNGVYVGASRAQRRLLIVDTLEGFKEFWNFAIDTAQISSLLNGQKGNNWREEDIQHMVRGESNTWVEDRDDPNALAERFFNQGKLEKSVYLLQLARNLYSSLNKEDKTEHCTALLHDIEGEYNEAAIAYERLGDLPEAIRCYWEAKDYNKISQNAAKDPGKFETIPFVVAARFINSRKTFDDAKELIQNLVEANQEQRQKQFKCSHWPEVIDQAIAVLSKSEMTTSGDYEEAYRILIGMKEDGLSIRHSQELAKLAFNAGDPSAALGEWGNILPKPVGSEPEFILRSRAKTNSYPMCLEWYQKLGDQKAIVREYESNSSTILEDNYKRIVLDALLSEQEYEKAIALLKSSNDWEAQRTFLKALPVTKVAEYSARSLLGSFLQNGVDRGEIRQVIQDIRPEKTDIPILKNLLSDDQVLIRVYVALIKILSRSQMLAQKSTTDGQFISGIIASIISKNAGKLKPFLAPEEVGAAFERAGRMDKILEFYETVFQTRKWGETNKETENNTKKRWLKCKQRQAEIDRKDQRRSANRLLEAKRRSSEWGILIPNEEYPVLSKLEAGEINNLFVEQLSHEKINKSLLSPYTTETTQAPVSLGASFADKSAVETQSKTDGFILPVRHILNCKVEISFKCGSTNLQTRLLSIKRRVELLDEDQNSTMINVKDGTLNSMDVGIAKDSSGSNLWHIKDWGLSIELTKGQNEIALVEFLDSEMRRIFCIAI